MITVNNYEEFAALLGQEIGTSDWLEITQERINMFADATLDHQWIHVDTERAKTGPFGQTIAHGYLTLSVLPYLWSQIFTANNVKMLVNYGIEKLKFGQPVLSGKRVRLVSRLENIVNLRGICKADISFKMEIEGEKKPALTGVATFLYHFA